MRSAATALVDPRFTTQERQPGLDLLRALAIVFVVLYHGGNFGFTLPHHWDRFGWIGVDVFFVLSGYLIGVQLLGRLACGQPVDLPRFFWRTALRILPAYLVVLAVYVAFPARREWPEMPPPWKFLGFVQNIDLHGGTAFSHAWSLCVEGQFYLVLPFVLIPVVQRRYTGIAVAVGVILVEIVLRTALASWHPAADGQGVAGRAYQHLIYSPTWTRLDPLVLGVGLAAWERFRPRGWQRLLDHAGWLLLLGLALIVFALALGETDNFTVAACVWQFPLLGSGASLLLICAVSERLPFRRVTVPGAAFVASVAYSVYLSHKLTIHLVSGFCGAHGLALTSPIALALNLFAIVLFGSALFFVVERPFLQIRRRVVPHTRLPTLDSFTAS